MDRYGYENRNSLIEIKSYIDSDTGKFIGRHIHIHTHTQKKKKKTVGMAKCLYKKKLNNC